jgi:hypothetical protein
MNPKWPLWIAASINTHFSAELDPLVIGPLGVKVFYEGQHRSDDLINVPDLIEVRFDGPYMYQKSTKRWDLKYEINLLVQSQFNDNNNYRVWQIIGSVCDAFKNIIHVYGYEEGVDPAPFIDCMHKLTGKDGRDDIIVHFFGQIEPNVKKSQGTVEAHYTIELEE